ncbi:MAG: hypothetical protein R3E08_11320 [Thiotrichaceae bacterium]
MVFFTLASCLIVVFLGITCAIVVSSCLSGGSIAGRGGEFVEIKINHDWLLYCNGFFGRAEQQGS